MDQSIYNFTVKTVNDEPLKLEHYKDKVLLIVNTASKCGFTPQYEGLQKLYQDHSEAGLEVLAFPCNQFGAQEPGQNQEIAQFCQVNFQTTFPLFAKIDVNGEKADPLYNYLKEQAPGLLGSQKIKWNFTKFLVNREGKVLKRYAPQDKPEKIEKDILELL